MIFESVQQWGEYTLQNWSTLKQEAETHNYTNKLELLVSMMLQPILPKTAVSLPQVAKFLRSTKHGEGLAKYLESYIKRAKAPFAIKTVVKKLVEEAQSNTELHHSLDRLVLDLGLLGGFKPSNEGHRQFLKGLLDDMWQLIREPSGLRVQAELISAGQNVAIAGRDVNIVLQQLKGSQSELISYLNSVIAEWGRSDFTHIVPGANNRMDSNIRFHQLYTPVDVWKENVYQSFNEERLTEFRFRAIENDLNDLRRPVLEAIATYPHLVITGAAGSGKSSIARFVAITLATACLPETGQREERQHGLDYLGTSWIHGAILPLLVTLRSFASSTFFPIKPEDGRAKQLLDFLKEQAGSFAPELETYITKQTEPYGAVLILDGLDEVYKERQRIVLQRIIEDWAFRFPKCRIIVTSRTYAYRTGDKWRLSEKFVAAELAPLTIKQMKAYITNWYHQAAITRASTFGGWSRAEEQTQKLTVDLIRRLENSKQLLPLMRQPLLLVMLVLLHEGNRRLPEKIAELYKETVDLLDRWVIQRDNEVRGMQKLNHDRMRDALKIVAFDLQRDQEMLLRYPHSVHSGQLRKRLQEQDRSPDGLGVAVKTVLDYLGTQHGILVSDRNGYYRFPHLSIQEYLAAQSLIELYDEIEMPKGLKPLDGQGAWSFPENVPVLLASDPYRWRNVAIFVGAILASDTGNDRRWNFIEELLEFDVHGSVDDGQGYCIYIAAEVWSSTYLKARLPTHRSLRHKLLTSLEKIERSEFLDAPERNQIDRILKQIQTDIDMYP